MKKKLIFTLALLAILTGCSDRTDAPSSAADFSAASSAPSMSGTESPATPDVSPAASAAPAFPSDAPSPSGDAAPDVSLTASAAPAVPSDTPSPTPEPSFLELHGSLSVSGADLTDCRGEKIQLYGVSTHGLAWFPEYVTEDSFRTLHEDWGINCIRLALYTEEYGGYCSGGDKDSLKALIQNGISYATDQDMYVIVDWHVLNDKDPNVHIEDSISFFREISEEYSQAANIIYEICNEPNGYATWDSVKEYADQVIPVIRENDPDALILVGSPTWSQDIDQALSSPLEYDNIMYTLHFYAGTHKEELRSRLKTCVDSGLPVFISEFGTCDASGNGSNDFEQTSEWLSLIEEYNLSFLCWNLSNKAESSSLISPSCGKTADWEESELSEAGKWMRNYFRRKQN